MGYGRFDLTSSSGDFEGPVGQVSAAGATVPVGGSCELSCWCVVAGLRLYVKLEIVSSCHVVILTLGNSPVHRTGTD